MSTEITEIKRDLKEVKRMLRQALPAARKETWVGVSVVKDLTGWASAEKLRWARSNNLVQYNKQKGYLLESIPPVFFSKNKN